MELSARRRRIIDPGQFLTGGPPAEIRGGRCEVPTALKIGDRGVVLMQDKLPSMVLFLLLRTTPEAGFQGVIWRQYDCSEK